jgi:glucokinase
VSTVVGIDVGGTKVATAKLGADGLSSHSQQPTRLSSTDELIDQFVELVAESAAGDRIDGVGIGVPSVVRFSTGEVVSSANIPLAGVQLRQVLGDRLGVPVFVDNDATVAALAEAHDENLELVSRNLVMITVGTGIGGGIVIDGRIFRGATGGAGEIGHTLIGLPIDGDVPWFGEHFPQRGSLEAFASGRALDRYVTEVAQSHPNSTLNELVAEGRRVSGGDAVQAAKAGDNAAAQAVSRWAHALGIGIANAINTFDPEEVVIGGGASAAGDLLLEQAKEIAAGYVLTGLQGLATVRFARFSADAGVLGAALLAAQELEHSR